jgi:23S rRNA pseudouridine2605 synthase
MRIRKPRTDGKVSKRREAISRAFGESPVQSSRFKGTLRAVSKRNTKPQAAREEAKPVEFKARPKSGQPAQPVLYEPAPIQYQRVPEKSKQSGATSEAFADRKMAAHETIRLNKFIAMSGKCSRRDADELIRTGQVHVNGRKVNEPGTQVMPDDEIVIAGELLAPEPMAYVLLHKPKNTITSVTDEQGRPTATDILRGAVPLRLYPVGRLDRNTSGLLIYTNDGELANRLLHPSRRVEKVYKFDVEMPIPDEQLELLKTGVKLEDGPAKAYFVQPMDTSKRSFKIGVTEGRNHLIRRMIDAIHAKLIRLKRTDFAGLKLGALLPGEWRFLTEEEVNKLRRMVELPPVKMKA